MSEYSSKLRAAYEAKRGLYKQFTEKNVLLLSEIFAENSDFQAIESRTKDLDSFEEKVDLPEKEQKYTDFSEVTDLCGIRIICYLNEDADRVCQRLNDIYEVDEKNSVNKNEELDINQFGYRSRHFVVQYDAKRAALEENTQFAGLKAEIQVRTILQHAWAAIDWKLRYKNSAETPKELRRRVFRVSALLELADDEFSSLSSSVAKLREAYKVKIDAGDFEIGIDRESVDLFLAANEEFSPLVEFVKTKGFSIAPNHPNARDPYGGFIATATSAGFTTINQLKANISNIEKDQRFEKIFNAWNLPECPPKLVISRAGLARLALIISTEKKEALRLANELPFGVKLQKAVLKILSD